MQLLPMASSPDGLISAQHAVITKTPGWGVLTTTRNVNVTQGHEGGGGGEGGLEGAGRGGGAGTRPWWLALYACGGAYWPLAFELSAMTSRPPGGGGGGPPDVFLIPIRVRGGCAASLAPAADCLRAVPPPLPAALPLGPAAHLKLFLVPGQRICHEVHVAHEAPVLLVNDGPLHLPQAPPECQPPNAEGPLEHNPPRADIGREEGGGVWHKASVSDCLPLAAPIGLSPLLILTLCGPERVLVVSTEGGGGGGWAA